jgi:hypothetical protein
MPKRSVELIVNEARAKDPQYSYADAMLTVSGKRLVADWVGRHDIDLSVQPMLPDMLTCE